MSRTPDLEAQNLEKNKNNTVGNSVELYCYKQSRFRNTNIEVVAIFRIYQVYRKWHKKFYEY